MNSNFNKVFTLSLVFVFTIIISELIFSQSRIAVLYSGYSEKYSENNSPKIIDEITLWELFLMQKKISYEVIYDRDLESGISDDFDILILPSVNAISSEEIKSLQQFLNNGKSILSVGSKLNLDSEGNFSRYQNIETLFDIQVDEFDYKKLSLFQTINFNPIFNNNENADGFIQISIKYSPLIATISPKNYFALGTIRSDDYSGNQTSLVGGLKSSGKFIWVGFNSDDVIGGKNDTNEFENLIINSLNWLDNQPDLWVSNFPEGQNSSTILLLENSYALAPELVDKLHQEGFKPHLVFSVDQKINETFWQKFDTDELILDLSNYAIADQNVEQKLVDAVTSINNGKGVSIKSIIISQSLIESAAIKSLNELGVEIFLYLSNFSGLPSLVNKNYLLIPYSEADKNNNGNSGIKFLTYKSKVNCDGNPDDDFLIKVAQSKTFENQFITLQLLKSWWKTKENVSVKINSISENSATIIISNNNPQDVEKINLIFNWPYQFNKDKVSINSGDEFIDYSFDDKMRLINLTIDKIGARQTKRIGLVFSEN